MTVTVQIPTALRRLTSGTGQVKCSAANLGELFSALDQQFPDLKAHLRDEAGEIRRFLNVYVNEEDIRFLGGNTYAFQDGDEVLLVPSIAGGTAYAMEVRASSPGPSLEKVSSSAYWMFSYDS
jgi:molybdopterin synthase sulfur carrier subunit